MIAKTFLRLFVFIFFSISTIDAFAEIVEVDNIYYELKGSNVFVAKGQYNGDIFIPEKIDYDGVAYYVVGINANAFDGAADVTSIVIPKSVTSLGSNCIANISLKSLIFSDGEDGITVSETKGVNSPIYKCSIDELYIGRSFSITSGNYTCFRSDTFNKIVFGEAITVIPKYLFHGELGETSEGILEIDKGITEVSGNAFSVSGIKHLVLNSSLSVFGSNMFNFDADFDSDIELESRATEPVYFDSSSEISSRFATSSSFKFVKLIIPKGSIDKYRESNWLGILTDENNVEEIEISTLDPGEDPGEEPGEDDEKVYVSLTVAHSTGANSYPRLEINKGDDFSLMIDVDNGWGISYASFVYDKKPSDPQESTKSARYVDDNAQSETNVEKVMEGDNRYKITVSGVNGDGHISYVVDRDIPVETIQIAADNNKPKVTVSYGEISVIASQDCGLRVYDLNGCLLCQTNLVQGTTEVLSGFARGVYVIKIDEFTFKVIL